MSISYQYIAGLLDGDGTIGIMKSNSRSAYDLRVTLYSQNIDTLTKIREQLGYGTYVGKYTTGFVFSLSFHSNQAVKLLRELVPYLMTRRPQALLGLEFQSKRTDAGGGPGRGISSTEVALREGYYIRMKELNAFDSKRFRDIKKSMEEGKVRPPTMLSVVVTN